MRGRRVERRGETQEKKKTIRKKPNGERERSMGDESQSRSILPPVDLSQEAQDTSIRQKFFVFFLLLGL